MEPSSTRNHSEAFKRVHEAFLRSSRATSFTRGHAEVFARGPMEASSIRGPAKASSIRGPEKAFKRGSMEAFFSRDYGKPFTRTSTEAVCRR
jgi:hypothetical protein